MPQEEVYEKISPMAKLVAHVRTLTDIPFAKDIASASGAEKDFQTIAGTSAESMSQFAFLWEARYKATDRIIAQYGVRQVLEIAAGLSPRGLAMTESPDVVYVATDLPQILEEEEAIAQSILAKLHIRRPNLHFTAQLRLIERVCCTRRRPFNSASLLRLLRRVCFFTLPATSKKPWQATSMICLHWTADYGSPLM